VPAVAHDAATGLAAGVTAVNAQRCREGHRPLEDELDVFHTEHEAQRLLGRLWRQVEGHWYAAEEADRRVARAKAMHHDARGPAARARAAWAKATSAFGWYERWEGLWRRAKAALQLFRRDGRRNDRAWAEAERPAVVGQLRAPLWKKLRGYLTDRRTLTFLDRLQRQLAGAEARPEVRAALVELWRLAHRPEQGSAAGVVLVAVQRLLGQKLAADWEAAYARVAAVLGRVVRASSAVECVNSVLRMHQGRQRRVSQGLLDLKRLYWNTRPFRSGCREGQSPYQHLGVHLPSYDFWELLHKDPSALAQELSTSRVAA
jgi:hypothetical protein